MLWVWDETGRRRRSPDLDVTEFQNGLTGYPLPPLYRILNDLEA